jgi:hypothetical protein
VSKWFDSGHLKGYRIPGSQDRRFPRKWLQEFLRDNGMLTERQQTNVVLFVSHRTELIDTIAAFLNDVPCQFHPTKDPFEIGEVIGSAVGEFCVAVVDVTTPTLNPAKVTENLLERHWYVVLLTEKEQRAPRGAQEIISFPFDQQLLAARLRSLIDG